MCATAAAVLGELEAARHFSTVAVKMGEMCEAFHLKHTTTPTEH
jgi:hypothetical protein